MQLAARTCLNLRVPCTIDEGSRSMYLPAEWGPRTRETTLLSDSATTTRCAELGCARRGSPEDQDERL